MGDGNHNILKNIFEKLKDKTTSFAFLKGLFIVFLGVVVIYVVSNLSYSHQSNNLVSTSSSSNYEYGKYLSTIEYASYLEDKLEGLFGNMYGVSKINAMVSLSGSSTFNYATSSSNNGGKDNIIFVEFGSEKYPLVLSEIMPKVDSVTIVCAGLTDAIKVDIVRSVATMFQLSCDRVYVLKG